MHGPIATLLEYHGPINGLKKSIKKEKKEKNLKVRDNMGCIVFYSKRKPKKIMSFLARHNVLNILTYRKAERYVKQFSISFQNIKTER